MREQDLLDHLPEPVGLLQCGARQRGGAHGQRSLVEIRQEGTTGERQHNKGDKQCDNAYPGQHLPAGDGGFQCPTQMHAKNG